MSASLVTNQNITSISLNTGDITTSNLLLSSSTMTNLSCSSATIPNVVHTSITTGPLVLTNSTISNLVFTNTTLSNLISGDIYTPQGAGFGIVKVTKIKNGITYNTASVICTITTPTSEAGGYTLKIWGSVGHALVSASTNTAVTFIEGSFNRSMTSSGTGVTSSIVQTTTTATATTSGTRDISTVTLSTTEVSEYIVDVSLTVDLTGSSVDTWYSVSNIELVYHGFTTNPIIT